MHLRLHDDPVDLSLFFSVELPVYRRREHVGVMTSASSYVL